MVPEYPKKISRISSVLFLVGSVIWVQWPIDFKSYNIFSIIVFIASFLSWVAIEAADLTNDEKRGRASVNEDVEKFNTIMGIIDERQYYIIRHCAIETYMQDDAYDGLVRLISYYNTDIFPFQSNNVQQKYSILFNNSVEFIDDLFSLYTSDGGGRMTWRSRDDGWVSDEIYKEVRMRVAKLNNQASTIADQLANFVDVARKELKDSDISIRQYNM